jgi:uncharacterized protein YeaO (DUF488 family)
MKTGGIVTQRWNDVPMRGRSLRVLVCRYRPRGVGKDAETWDRWLPELGPSRALHADYYGKHGSPISWTQYRQRYLAEMAGPRARGAIAELAARIAKGDKVVLLCSSACTDAARCHRTLLKQLVLDCVASLRVTP